MRDVRNRCYRFDEVRIDSQNLRVTVGSEIRSLEPKSFKLLVFLVENPRRALPKEEIMAAIWPDAFVSDNSLTRAITQIRKALDDDPKAPRYIETVPTVGYRFVGDCEEEHDPTPASVTADAVTASPAMLAEAPKLVRPNRRPGVAVAAALIGGLAAGGWLLAPRTAHSLTEKDTIVLADFANTTGDPVFDDALKQGLAVQLGQSPLLNILSDQRVRSTLKEMTRSPDEALTTSVAQEVCERTGSKAYIAGSIADLGGHYAIGVNAIDCATGDALAREQIEAVGKQQVLAALGQITERLRNKLGESLNSIKKFDVPLAQATTSSLEALKAYSWGLSKYAGGDPADAVTLFRQAIDLDPDFAIAYANLGRAYQVLGQHQHMTEALTRAFALRNRTSERENFDISSGYYQFIVNQADETIQNCELWAQIYPRDFTPHRILGFESWVLGQFDRAAEEFGKAKELDPTQALPYSGLMFAYMGLNRLSEARRVYEEAESRKLNFGEPERGRYVLAFLEGDTQTMTKVASSLAGRRGYESKASNDELLTEAYFGHLGRAEDLSRQARDAALREGDRKAAAEIQARTSLLEALFGKAAEARQNAAAAGPAAETALALALVGDVPEATKIADDLAGDVPAGGFISKVQLPEARAAIELQTGNPMRAVELLAPVARYEAGAYDHFLAAYLRGEAYRAEHRGQEAAVEFQKIIDHRGMVLNFPMGPLARLGAARSYALAGDTRKAAAAYQDFLTLWKDADPGIPILAAAKSEYAKLK